MSQLQTDLLAFSRRVGRRIPLQMWAITALWGGLLLGASLLWPISYGYDEVQHLDMAYVYSSDPLHFYGPGELHQSAAAVAIEKQSHGTDPRLSTVHVVARADRPSLSGLGGSRIVADSPPNQMVQHPPLYYWTAAVVLRIPGVSNLAWDVQAWLVRLLSVLFLLPVPGLCWAATRRLISEFPATMDVSVAPLLAAVIPLSVPNLVRDGSSVSNDSLLILTTSVVVLLACRVMTGDLTRRTGVWLGVALAAALLTKGFALVLPPIVLIAYVLGSRRGGVRRLRTAIPAAVPAVVGMAVGGSWWLHNLLEYHAIQFDGYGTAYEPVLYGAPDNRGTLAGFIPKFLDGVAQRTWGGIGLPDSPTPGVVVIVGWLVVVGIGVVTGALLPSRVRGVALVLTSIPVLTVFVFAYGSYGTYRRWSDVVAAAQGRYLYSAIVPVAVVAVLGWTWLTRGRLRRWLVPAVLAAALATQADAWLAILRGWYAPVGSSLTGGFGSGIATLLRWSPVPEAVTILLVGILPVALAILAMTVMIRDSVDVRDSV